MLGGGFSKFPSKRGGDGPKKGVVPPIQIPHKKPSGFIEHGPRVISNKMPPKSPERSSPIPNANKNFKGPQALWTGVIHGYSGYAKANREILKRIAPFAKIKLSGDMPWDPIQADAEARYLRNALLAPEVTSKSPHVTFLPPTKQYSGPKKITYTMMETEVVHHDMISTMNDNYHECWVPTRWNAETFRRSGLTIPTFVMPLGVDPAIYYPTLRPQMPMAKAMTGPEAGNIETPSGFIFVYVCQPSFRKGIDVLLSAFEEAFWNDRQVGLILGCTAYSLESTYMPMLS